MRLMAPNLHPAEERARVALNIYANIEDLSDDQLASRLDMTRTQINDRKLGRTKIKLPDIDRFAEKLGIPAPLWTGETADLLQWFADRERRGETGTTRRKRRIASDLHEHTRESTTKAA